jgi:hypothetical protein
MKTTGCGLGGRVGKLRRAWPAIMLLAFAIKCSCAYADDPKANFVFVDGTAVTLSPDSSDAFKFDTPVKNSGGNEGVASVKLLSDKDKRCDPPAMVDPKTTLRLSSNAVEITLFEIKNVKKLPATCYIELVTEGEGGNTSLKQIKLSQPYVTWAVLILLGFCLGVSVVVAGVTWFLAHRWLKRIHWKFKLGPPAWDFTKSWTSTTTLVGVIISTALTLSALPELTKHASKSGYSTLALLISFAVIIAPFVFIAFRMGTAAKEEATEKNYAVVYQGYLGVVAKYEANEKKYGVVYQGYLWAFLLSCTITVFAGLAQLVVLSLLLHEVSNECRFWSFLLLLLTVGLGIGLCWYSGNSMYLTIKLQTLVDRENAVIDGNKGPLLTWPVL